MPLRKVYDEVLVPAVPGTNGIPGSRSCPPDSGSVGAGDAPHDSGGSEDCFAYDLAVSNSTCNT